MEIIKNIEQRSPEWHIMRAWVITWTRLNKIMWNILKNWSIWKAKPWAMETLAYELIGGQFSFDKDAPDSRSYVMKQGCEFEDIAVKEYEKMSWNKVEEVGFIKLNNNVWLSPDWLVMKEKIIIWAFEWKVPIWSNSKNFFQYIAEWWVPKEYFWQVVHYFIVIDTLEWLDFGIYNPNLILWDDLSKMWIYRVKREDILDEIEAAKESIAEFILVKETLIKKILPYIKKQK